MQSRNAFTHSLIHCAGTFVLSAYIIGGVFEFQKYNAGNRYIYNINNRSKVRRNNTSISS